MRIRPAAQSFAVFYLALSIVFFSLVAGNVAAHGIGKKGKSSLSQVHVLDVFTPGKNQGKQPLTNLIDGNASTQWVAGKLPRSFVLELGVSQKISQVGIAVGPHKKNRQHRYAISVSQDGVNWLPVVKNRPLAGGRLTRAGFNPINARYVRITLNAVAHSDSLAIREFKVYGIGGGSVNNGGGSKPRKLTLQWIPSPGRVSGYLVFYGSAPSMASAQISDIPVNMPGFNPQAPSMQYDAWRDLNARPGDNVCFRVRAYDSTGLSAWSAPVCSGV